MSAGIKKFIYFDNAATTPISEEVKTIIHEALNDFGNPSGKYLMGVMVKNRIDAVRDKIKKFVGAEGDDKVIFTGGGSEANNLAIKGAIDGLSMDNPHIITSLIEHPSVLNTFKHMEAMGYDVSYIPVDKDGIVRVDMLRKAIKPNTAFISIMYANNETGVIQPVEEIGTIAHENNIIFHTDAIQAFGKIPIHIHESGVDMVTVSGHKIYAPKGIGCVVVRNGIELAPIIHGGGQESGIRSGTENTVGIIALGKAIEMVENSMELNYARISAMKKALIDNICRNIPDTQINGDPAKALPNILNISFLGIEAEAVLYGLDYQNICVAKGSACSSNSIVPSHVLTAMGISAREALGAIRFSFGLLNDISDIDTVMRILPGIVENARRISPAYK